MAQLYIPLFLLNLYAAGYLSEDSIDDDEDGLTGELDSNGAGAANG